MICARCGLINPDSAVHCEHLVIGGPYFDVLDGEYVLEELRPNVTRVHLASHHRLTTTLAPYAHLWSDAILKSVQDRILSVIRHRCELVDTGAASTNARPLPG